MDFIGIAWTAVGIGVPALVAIGTSIVLVGSAVTRSEVRFAQLCFVGSAVALAATEITWIMITDKPFWWRAATGLLVGAVVFVGLPEGLRWVKNRQSIAPATLGEPAEAGRRPQSRLLFECNVVGPGEVVPPSGVVHSLLTWPVPLENGGGGMAVHTSSPGGPLPRPTNPEAIGYKCRIISYAPATITNLKVQFYYRFNNVLTDTEQPNLLRSGGVFLERPWQVEVGRLEPGPDRAFEFYADNLSDKFLTIHIPDHAVGRRVDSEQSEEFEIIHAQKHGLMLGPGAARTDGK